MSYQTWRQTAAYLATAVAGLASLGTSYDCWSRDEVSLAGEVTVAKGDRVEKHFRVRTTGVPDLTVEVTLTGGSGRLSFMLVSGELVSASVTVVAGSSNLVGLGAEGCGPASLCVPRGGLPEQVAPDEYRFVLVFEQVMGDATATFSARAGVHVDECATHDSEHDQGGEYLELIAE